jgi:hypothetical protein
MCVLDFCCCDEIPDINNLKERKVYFGSQFQKVQSIAGEPHSLGQNLRAWRLECVMEESHSLHGGWEGRGKRERRAGIHPQ